MQLPKLLIIGHGRHGKDTVCDLIKDRYGFSFRSSSEFCAEHLIFPALKDTYGYENYTQCFNDRHNHRTEWYTLIHDYCKEDHARLGREIFEQHNVYCGLRNPAEFHAMKNQKVFDYAIWVDRSEHLPEEPVSSMGLKQWMADYTIDNNSTLAMLEKNTFQLMDCLVEVKFP